MNRSNPSSRYDLVLTARRELRVKIRLRSTRTFLARKSVVCGGVGSLRGSPT